MKKTYMTLLACAALGTAYGQEVQEGRGFSLELNAAYNFALKDIIKESPSISVNTYGAELTPVYRINERHSFNIRCGWMTGSDDESMIEDGAWGKADVDVTNIYIMPGYRYTAPVSDTLRFFGGVNAGMVQTKVDIDLTVAEDDGVYVGSGDCSKWGMAWSAEVGIDRVLTDTSHITLAVQLQGLYGQPKLEDLKMQSQLNLGIRLGYSARF